MEKNGELESSNSASAGRAARDPDPAGQGIEDPWVGPLTSDPGSIVEPGPAEGQTERATSENSASPPRSEREPNPTDAISAEEGCEIDLAGISSEDEVLAQWGSDFKREEQPYSEPDTDDPPSMTMTRPDGIRIPKAKVGPQDKSLGVVPSLRDNLAILPDVRWVPGVE